MIEKREGGQTALEYIMIIGGAIMFVVIVVVIIRSGIIAGQTEKVGEDVCKFQDKYLQPDIMIFDNFNSDETKNWQPSAGTWQVINNAYIGGSTPGTDDETFTFRSFSNFSVIIKVRQNVIGASDGIGMYFRNGTGAYVLEMAGAAGDDAIAIKKVGGATLYSGTLVNGDFNNWVVLKLRAKGNTIELYQEIKCKDNFIVSISDSSYTYGKFGLFSIDDDSIEVDDFIVYLER